MQIELIERSQRHRWQGPLRRAFALRHRVFVDGRGWEFLRQPDRLDVDQYDAGDTTHILALEGEAVLGHLRLIPGGYLVVSRADPDLLRQAAADAVLLGPSRLCVDAAFGARGPVIFSLATAAFDYALERGAGAFLFDTDPRLVILMRAIGLSLTTVGEPVPAGHRTMQPVVMRLAPSIAVTLRRNLPIWNRGPAATEAFCFGN